MATITTTSATDTDRTLADLLADLGGIDPARVRLHPFPGTATEEDLERVNDEGHGLYELIDGVLVGKTMGLWESMLAATLLHILIEHVKPRNLGIVTAPDGHFRLGPKTSRAPDVSFFSRDRIRAAGGLNRDSLKLVAPDLAIEILSPSNRPGEMARKRRDYFAAGVQVVWEVDAEARTVTVYHADETRRVDAGGTLDGGVVLPDLVLPVARIFEDVDQFQNDRPR